MQIFILAIIAIVSYFGTMVGFGGWINQQTEKSIVSKTPITIGWFASVAMVLGMAGATILFPTITWRQFSFMAIIFFSLIYAEQKWPQTKFKFFWLLFLILFGTTVLAEILPNLPLNLTNQLIMATVWMLVTAMVIFFDTLPLVSFLTAGAWTIAFIILTMTPSTFPGALAVLMLLTLAPFYGLLNMSAKYLNNVCFGRFGATLLGYVMGGVIAVCVGCGSYATAVTLSSYYLFELCFISLTLFGWHPLGMNKGDFAFSKCLAEAKTTALVKVLFAHLIALALLGTLMWHTEWFVALMLATLIILVNLYNRYKSLGAPAPGFNDMWIETKKLVKLAWQKCQKTQKTEGVKTAPTTKPKIVKKTQKKTQSTIKKKKVAGVKTKRKKKK